MEELVEYMERTSKSRHASHWKQCLRVLPARLGEARAPRTWKHAYNMQSVKEALSYVQTVAYNEKIVSEFYFLNFCLGSRIVPDENFVSSRSIWKELHVNSETPFLLVKLWGGVINGYVRRTFVVRWMWQPWALGSASAVPIGSSTTSCKRYWIWLYLTTLMFLYALRGLLMTTISMNSLWKNM